MTGSNKSKNKTINRYPVIYPRHKYPISEEEFISFPPGMLKDNRKNILGLSCAKPGNKFALV